MIEVFIPFILSEGAYMPLGAFTERDIALQVCRDILRAKRPDVELIENDCQVKYADIDYAAGDDVPSFIHSFEIDNHATVDFEIRSIKRSLSRKAQS